MPADIIPISVALQARSDTSTSCPGCGKLAALLAPADSADARCADCLRRMADDLDAMTAQLESLSKRGIVI